MLHPRQRALLLDTMRPPQGYQLDHAIGTTYSLDLKMLLNVPLAFTFEGWEDDEGITRDPHSLLRSVESYADKMHLFCQAGQIKAPAKTHKLLSYLEDSVFEVNVPRTDGRGGVFHPKVWVLRYLPDPAYEEEDEEERPVHYRLLCLSRNLTFDSAWDTCLALDGELTDRRNAFAKNHPVGEFLEALPDLAVSQGSEPLEKARKKILEMSREVRRVDFEPPPGIDSCHFHPLGIDGRYPWPFPEDGYRSCIVSPFLSNDLLINDFEKCEVLISIPEWLEKVDRDFLEERKVYVLNPEADPEVEGDKDDLLAGSDTQAGGGEHLARLRGLHAKLFIVEKGWHASVFTGSANATSAAFRQNIEFLVELRAGKKFLGIDELLQEEGMIDFLIEYVPPNEDDEDEETEDDAVIQALDEELEKGCRILCEISIRAAVKTISGAGEEKYSIELESMGKSPELPGGVTALVWPALSPRKETALEQGGARLASFERVPLESLCSFFSFRLTAEAQGQTRECSFTRNCQLVGAPDDRRERLLPLLLENSGAVLKYIYMLLGSEELGVADLVAKSAGMKTFAGQGEAFPEEFPLLELMLKKLVDSPETLGEVRQLIEDLRKTEEGRKLLPAGIEELLQPIWEVKEAVK